MNLTQAKALFFSQYLWQKVFNDGEGEYLYPLFSSFLDVLHERHYLQLRSVSQLTDEERLQVGIIAFPMFVPFPEKDYDTLRKLALTVLERGHLGSRTHQVLVRYGVLAPFTYLNEENKPVTLQPDEIIKLGWAKINKA